ncbi:AAA family ATPase [Streptomyces sp. NEAU-W12]|uniref:AAA family ATPase n=1 Tax=Streptomyces sp. NEAU-W12 TaxID=2994668 RepID=UPI00224ABD3A|nr:AAA family ATPase [Streptomyces sp. NEAU-W12]MCX2927041.1 AAA family ATPase [Streptomyces sp. NEAU-W12]
MEGQRCSEHRALVVGIEGPAPDLEGEDQPEWPPLPFAPKYAGQLRDALRFFGYRPHDTEGDPSGSASALERAVESVLEAGPGFVVVHVLAHGKPADSGGVYVVGGDARLTRHDIESWLKLVEDAGPDESAPYVLFLLDLCYSGNVARREWQHALPGDRRRAWVLAAGGVGEQTYDGRLTRAVTEVLGRFANESVRVDPSVPYIPFPLFCRQVMDLVDAYTTGGPPQKALDPMVPVSAAELSHLAFFPNPAYGRGGPRTAARARVDRTVTALLDEVADVRHFTGRASGTEAVFGEGGPMFFRGREAEVRSLADWLRGGGPDLRVVTGRPGVGKSALLGALVCAAHPELRGGTHQVWTSRADAPPMVPGLAVVHARRRSVPEVMAGLGRQWKLGTTHDVTDVVAALRERPRPPVLILDALDEAEHPRELMTALLALAPACRMLVGVRPGRRFAPLFRRAGGGRVDLDAVPDQRLRDELRDYLRGVLAVDDRYATAEGEGTAGRLADGIARELVRRGVPECGEFLVAALYVRHVLDQPFPDGPAEVRRLVGSVPRDLRKVMNLHLEDRWRPLWTDAVLLSLAHARGTGMPEEVVRTVAAVFAPRAPRTGQVREVLDTVRFYLRRDVDGEGRTVYRLFHQGLADLLRSEGPYADAVFTRLLTLVRDPRHWATAEPYLLRHAAGHAAEAGRLPELLDDVEFVLHADADALERQLRPLQGRRWLPEWARRDRLPPLAGLYADTADVHRHRTPAQRRQILTVAAARQDERGLARVLGEGGSWRAHRVGRVPAHAVLQDVPGDATLGPVWADRPSPVTSLVPVDLDGRPHLVTASRDGQVRVWDLRGRRVVASGVPPLGVDRGQSRAACAVLGSEVLAVHWFEAAGGGSSRLNVWELPGPRFARESAHVSRQLFVAVAGATVRGRPVAVLCGRRWRSLLPEVGVLVLWDLRENRRLGEPLLDGGRAVRCVAVATVEGRAHAVTGGDDGAVRVWDLEAGGEARVLTGHEGAVGCVAVATVEGRAHAVTGGDDGAVRVWDLQAGGEARVLARHEGAVRCATVASVGGRAHALTAGLDGTVRASDLLTGVEAHVLCLPGKPRALTAATDGTVVVALGDTLVALEPGGGLVPFLPWSAVARV